MNHASLTRFAALDRRMSWLLAELETTRIALRREHDLLVENSCDECATGGRFTAPRFRHADSTTKKGPRR